MRLTEAVCRSVESRTLAFARGLQASVLEAVEVSLPRLPRRSGSIGWARPVAVGRAAQAAVGEVVIVVDTLYDTTAQLVALHREFVHGLLDLTVAPAEPATSRHSAGLRSVG